MRCWRCCSRVGQRRPVCVVTRGAVWVRLMTMSPIWRALRWLALLFRTRPFNRPGGVAGSRWSRSPPRYGRFGAPGEPQLVVRRKWAYGTAGSSGRVGLWLLMPIGPAVVGRRCGDFGDGGGARCPVELATAGAEVVGGGGSISGCWCVRYPGYGNCVDGAGWSLKSARNPWWLVGDRAAMGLLGLVGSRRWWMRGWKTTAPAGWSLRRQRPRRRRSDSMLFTAVGAGGGRGGQKAGACRHRWLGVAWQRCGISAEVPSRRVAAGYIARYPAISDSRSLEFEEAGPPRAAVDVVLNSARRSSPMPAAATAQRWPLYRAG